MPETVCAVSNRAYRLGPRTVCAVSNRAYRLESRTVCAVSNRAYRLEPKRVLLLVLQNQIPRCINGGAKIRRHDGGCTEFRDNRRAFNFIPRTQCLAAIKIG